MVQMILVDRIDYPATFTVVATDRPNKLEPRGLEPKLQVPNLQHNFA